MRYDDYSAEEYELKRLLEGKSRSEKDQIMFEKGDCEDYE